MQYFTACKPGMVGDGIRSVFAVSDSGEDLTPKGDDKALVDEANKNYQAYVKDQTEQLVAKTKEFAALYTAGKDDEARAAVPGGPGALGADRDRRRVLRRPRPEDGRPRGRPGARPEVDRLAPDREGPVAGTGQGLHAADAARSARATPTTWSKNTDTLYQRIRTLSYTADQIANGSKGLLDEVATGKVTGEEEYWSRTDLWDFQANVDGARVGFEGLKPLLQKRGETDLEKQIETKFAALQTLLDAHQKGDGFVLYNELTPERGQGARPTP